MQDIYETLEVDGGDNMNVLIRGTSEDSLMCPYCDAHADVCAASLTSIKIEKSVRSNRCNSESYDNCALFLAKSLRLRW
jgi:hypothetical protein